MNEFLVMCQHQATASDLPFYDIFAPTKNFSFQVSDDVIACGLWFGPPQSKILATPKHQSQIIGGDADVDHTQTIVGDTVKLLGDISPLGFGTPASINNNSQRV